MPASLPELEVRVAALEADRAESKAAISAVLASNRQILERLDSVDRRLADHDGRFDTMDRRFDEVDRQLLEHDRRFEAIDQRLAEHDERHKATMQAINTLSVQTRERFDVMDTRINRVRTRLDDKIDGVEQRLTVKLDDTNARVRSIEENVAEMKDLLIRALDKR